MTCIATRREVGSQPEQPVVVSRWVRIPAVGATRTAAISRRIAPFLPPVGDSPRARMLLLQRAGIDGFAREVEPDVDWANAGVAPETVECATVSHLNYPRPEVFDATRESIAAFLATGMAVADPRHRRIDIVTSDGALFRMLEAGLSLAVTAALNLFTDGDLHALDLAAECCGPRRSLERQVGVRALP